MKLQANNLRIGNLLMFDNDFIIIDQIYKKENSDDYYVACDKVLEYRLNELKPIPLTEEWLLKFGISKWILDVRFEVRLNEAYGISIYAWQSGNCIFICHLDYVHQFQNWYYLHSKEKELTLNLSL